MQTSLESHIAGIVLWSGNVGRGGEGARNHKPGSVKRGGSKWAAVVLAHVYSSPLSRKHRMLPSSAASTKLEL